MARFLCLVMFFGINSSVLGSDVFRIGFWNIEWLGQPSKRSGIAKDVHQTPEDIAMYVSASGVQVLGLAEICDDDEEDDVSSNSTLDDAINLLNSNGGSWKYVLLPKKNPADLDQHVGVAWNDAVVQMKGQPFQLPIDTSHPEFDLLVRSVHAIQFGFGTGKTDFVLIPLHLKSNRGGAAVTKLQRAEEAKRIMAAMTTVRRKFHDQDVVILGDFNTLSVSESAISHVADAGFRDLNSEDSPTVYRSNAPFDRIFVPVGQAEFVSDSQQVFSLDSIEEDEHKTRLSDHFMVTAAINVVADDDDGALPGLTRDLAFGRQAWFSDRTPKAGVANGESDFQAVKDRCESLTAENERLKAIIKLMAEQISPSK
jgi:hypothetical protein